MFKTTQQEPDIPAALSPLQNYTTEQLKELLNDEEKFEELIKDNKQLLELEAEKKEIMVRNRSLAEFNLTKEPELEEAKRRIQSLSEEGSQLCSKVQALLEQIANKAGTMTVDLALDLLQTAAAEIEEESEKVAEKFLAGETEVDEFLEQFLSRRKIMHLRKVKVDKMRELMRRPPQAANPVYPAAGGYPGMTPQVPYPTEHISMPMPVPPF
ncbi:vacuolar protein sorting-associated protein 37C [Copidosoma floridanum]|uniref:vacuolar protein sorting-associated protein 37C n=1 Tax=Copidosoma floridanum TaxID=29053 RepID=UPI0006C999E3|nr:vacuolar protein sorting-associated protein 37C [Copidosoma floridanum]